MFSVCGIDFGTTNSALGIALNAETVRMIPLEDKNIIIPTALFFPKNKSDPLIGREALLSYTEDNEGRFMRSIKRILGTDLMDRKTLINGIPVSFDKIIYFFLKEIKKRAEKKIGSALEACVIGCPVHFQDNDPDADTRAKIKLRNIAQSTGFKEIAFQYEPIAAAMAHEKLLTREKLALVADIGGGTSDFTVIRVGPKRTNQKNRENDILSTGGIRTGGNDFDKNLSMRSVMPAFGRSTLYGPKRLKTPEFLYANLSEWSQINKMYETKYLDMTEEMLLSADEPDKLRNLKILLETKQAHRLLNMTEDLKIALSRTNRANAWFNSLDTPLFFEESRERFNLFIDLSLEKISTCLHQTLADAGISADQINLVILTGGSCEIPAVSNLFKSFFPNASVSENEKLSSVSVGLSSFAYTLFS